MRFIHLGDLHIGKTLGEFGLYDDQKYILDQIIDIIREKSVDAALIAGDVYDRALPSESAVGLLDHFICNLADNGIETFIISGNHDSEERLRYGGSLFEDKGIHIVSGYDGKLRRYDLEDEFGQIHIYPLPFIKASQVRYYHPDDEINSYEDAVRTVLEHAEIDFSDRNILIAHQFVTGEKEPAIAGSEGASVQNVGLVEKISCEIFKDFAYVALGHLHSPQRVGYDHIRYSGPPLKYSLSEAVNNKSIPVITLENKGELDIDIIPVKPLRDLRHITGPMAQLLSRENLTDTDDFIYVTLTDEDIVNDAMNIIRQYYPNTIRIDYRNSHTREIENCDITDIDRTVSFDELISDFYKLIYGTDISGDELDMMLKAAGEAGVINEAG